jgi:membrane-associated PAP2 superfamily phosphatase
MLNASLTASQNPWKRAMLLTILALAAGLLVAEFTPLDFWVSDHFYDANSRNWLVKHSGQAKSLFYTWPLRVLKMFGVVVLVTALVPHRWLAPRWRLHKRELAVVFLALTLVPSVVGSLKAWTGMFCPRQLVRYGGTRPVASLFEHAPEACCGETRARGRCWPAGHASGGFALMSLCVMGRTRAQKFAGAALGLIAGWTMGLYQMLNGNHYLSHTIITMLLAWLGVLLLRRALQRLRPDWVEHAWRSLSARFYFRKGAAAPGCR